MKPNHTGMKAVSKRLCHVEGRNEAWIDQKSHHTFQYMFLNPGSQSIVKACDKETFGARSIKLASPRSQDGC